MAKILFDEAHDELLTSQVSEGDQESDTYSILRQELGKIGLQFAVHQASAGPITHALAEYDVLVLAAPTQPLSLAEVNAMTDFVQRGKALLIANNAESLWQQASNSANLLLESFGLGTERLLSHAPQEITALRPHYVSSGVNRLTTVQPAYLETLDSLPYVVAALPWTDKPFIAAVESKSGRLVAIADFVMFGDKHLSEGDNRQLALNIFSWLARENVLDCYNAHLDPQVRFGHPATFSITLSNPHADRLEYIRCHLESDASAQIQEPVLRIRSIPANGQTWLQWSIEPRKLGSQRLRLTTSFPRNKTHLPLVFDTVAQFQCVPDAEIDLVVPVSPGNALGIAETGVAFEAQAVVRWAKNAHQVPLQFELDCPLAHMTVEPASQADTHRWRLTALDQGDWPITLIVSQTKQRVSRLVRVQPSAQTRIASVERDIVAPLSEEIQRLVSQLRREFDEDAVRRIPFRLFVPEDQVCLLYPPEVAKRLEEILQSARTEMHANRRLVEQILRNITPTYSPVHGCCIPYDPKLAADLAGRHELYEENLIYNFMSMEGRDQTTLEQNVAAFLLHEKFGHGFFFTRTVLGQQLAILHRYGLVRPVDYERLLAPYPRRLHEAYREAIQALSDSAVIVNEGFAAWLELAVLPRLAGAVGQSAYQRRDFLFNRDEDMVRLAKQSQYFQRFPPFRDSRYQEGCEYFDLIQGYFGKDCGFKCAVQAMLKAAQVHVGISESDGQVWFALGAEPLKAEMLDAQHDDARADMRLRRIHSVLRKYSEQIRVEQKRLQCHRVCLHHECPINATINQRLGW